MIDIDLSKDSSDLRKLRRQARSNIKFEVIVEALKVYYNHRDKWDPIFYSAALKSREWENIGAGLYKECFAKGSIVVKFPRGSYYAEYADERRKELAREYDQWFNPPSPEFRKYLPRSYALIDETILIQDRVLGKCVREFNIDRGYETCNQISKVEALAATYMLQDYYQNHGHTLKGNIKFFDSVWGRWRDI